MRSKEGPVELKRLVELLHEIKSVSNALACFVFDKRGLLVTKPIGGEGVDVSRFVSFSVLASLMIDRFARDSGIGGLRVLVVDAGDDTIVTRKIEWGGGSEYYLALLMGSDAPIGLAIIEAENIEKNFGGGRGKEARRAVGGVEPEVENLMAKLEQHPLFKALVSRGESEE